MKRTFAALAVLFFATSAQAQSFVLGGGATDFNNPASEDSGIVTLEYHHNPLYQTGRFELGLAAALTVHTSGDLHAGLGVSGIYGLGERWFLEGSVLPGVYFENEDSNWIGGRFQIRSLLGVGYILGSGDRLSVGISHISNASTTDFNPGVNTVQLRWRRAF